MEALEKIGKGFESIVKILGLLSLLAYISGVIICSLHYAQYDLMAIDFLSPKYVITGSIALFSLFVSAVLFAFLAFGWIGSNNFTRNIGCQGTPLWLKLLSTILFFFLWLQLASFISNGIMNDIVDNNTRSSLFNYLRWQTVGVTIYIGMALLYNPKSKGRTAGAVPEFLIGVNYVFQGIFMYVVFITGYTWFVYKNLPHSFGGGQLSKITLYIKKENCSPELRGLIIKSDSINKGVNKFDLVKESSESYYLLISKSPVQIVEIPKRITQGSIISDK